MYHATQDPSPGGKPVAITSTTPPAVVPASFMASIQRIASASASASAIRNGLDSARNALSGSPSAPGGTRDTPMEITCPATATPTSRSSRFARAPAITLAAVSLALARSRTLRTSVWPNFSAPGRSAWPGRTVSSASTSAPSPSCAIFPRQFSQSRFRSSIATGPPSVFPKRMPERISTRSFSISIRPPRP